MSLLPPVRDGKLLPRREKSPPKPKKIKHVVAYKTTKNVVRFTKGKRKKKYKRDNVNYYQYLKTRQWKSKYRKYKKRCVACRTTEKKLVLHHKTYERVGHEKYGDLVMLCWECHEALHEAIGVKRNMVKETDEFITEMRSSLPLLKEVEQLSTDWI